MTVGARIRALREKRGISRAALAKAAGVSESAIERVEGDYSQEPRYSNGLRIADALGVDPYELAGIKRRTVAAPPARDLTAEMDDVKKRLEALERRRRS